MELFDLLVFLKLQGKAISARDVCLIAHYATLGGLIGEATKLARKPGLQSGKYNHHFKQCTLQDAELDDAIELKLPGYNKWSDDSVELKIPAFPFSVLLRAEIDSFGVDDFASDLSNFINADEWGSVYRNNPVVLAHPGELVHPYGLFVDGVPFQKRDGLIGFSIHSLVSQARHYILVLRKSELCHCGCLGWCTFYAVWQWFAIQVNELADTTNAHFHSLLLRLSGDWLEFVHTYGLKRWDDLFHPCFGCLCPKDRLMDVGSLSAISCSFPQVTNTMYQQACAKCEITVHIIDTPMLQRLLGHLDYPRGRGGHRGRVVVRDFIHGAGILLLTGDRLDPSPSCPNIRYLSQVVPPCDIIFWRPANQTICSHRCPLFFARGVGVESCAIDGLHTLNLGPYKDFCVSAIWATIDHNIWNVKPTAPSLMVEACTHLIRRDLFAWYSSQRSAGIDTCELQDLTISMLGTHSDRYLSTKGAETGTLLRYCAQLVGRNVSKLGTCGPYLQLVGDSLCRVQHIFKISPTVMPPANIQTAVDAYKTALKHRENAGIAFKPKWHLATHLVSRCHSHGNPSRYSAFFDESCNSLLKKVAAKSHRMTWHRSVLSAMRWITRKTDVCKKRRT